MTKEDERAGLIERILKTKPEIKFDTSGHTTALTTTWRGLTVRIVWDQERQVQTATVRDGDTVKLRTRSGDSRVYQEALSLYERQLEEAVINNTKDRISVGVLDRHLSLVGAAINELAQEGYPVTFTEGANKVRPFAHTDVLIVDPGVIKTTDDLETITQNVGAVILWSRENNPLPMLGYLTYPGVEAWLPKTTGVSELGEAIEAVAAGRPYECQSMERCREALEYETV